MWGDPVRRGCCEASERPRAAALREVVAGILQATAKPGFWFQGDDSYQLPYLCTEKAWGFNLWAARAPMALYGMRLAMICAIVLSGVFTWGVVAYQSNENACAQALVVKQCEHAHRSV